MLQFKFTHNKQQLILMFSSNDSFVEYLQSHKGERVFLKPYIGNSGDHLIWMGNQILLKKLGLVEVIDPCKADIILWPGGNPTMWGKNLEGWQDCWRRWPATKFVVAPATIQGQALDWRNLLRNAPENVIGVFARDPESHRNLANAGLRSDIKIGLGHDPAFNLRESEWISLHREAATAEYVLASFRGDHESALAPLSRNKLWKMWPVSSVTYRLQRHRQKQFHQARLKQVRGIARKDQPIIDCDAPLMSFESFVECVQRASEVHTDRLHCMILALLLGKEVFAYPTAYGKLEAVYEHSIKPWANVQLVHEYGM